MDNNKLEAANADRANEVSQLLANITKQTKNNFFTICDLLLEADEGDYFQYFGCKNFTEWVEQSEFDFSWRQAYYYLSVAKKTRELGLSKDQLAEIPISKLKEILSLEPAEHEKTIRALLEEADSLSVEEVKDKVKGIKKKSGEEVWVHYNFKITEETKETLEEAFELARKINGSTVDETTGEVKDISNSRCLEFIAASFLQDVNNYPEKYKRDDPELEVLI